MDDSGSRLVHGGVERFPYLASVPSRSGIGALIFGGFTARAFVICLVISLAIAGLVTSALKSQWAVTGRIRCRAFAW